MNEPVTGSHEAKQSLTPKGLGERSLASTGAESTALEPPQRASPSPQRGNFTILKEHARGGLGKVSVALDARLKRQVALKEIRPDRLANPALRQRFIAEAEITGTLEHPGIVPIYALEEDEGGQPYYAMRFIQGRTLAEAIRAYHQDSPMADARGSPLAFRELLQRFVSVCQTIAFAHSKGVIHRDLKPANVMLGDYGETLVVDWGLAKRLGAGAATAGQAATAAPAGAGEGAPSQTIDYVATEADSGRRQMTSAGQVLGTPAYMSPEQAAGAEVGPPTDLYALGAILYELLSARSPYAGRDAQQVLAAVMAGPPVPPSAVQRGVPKPLEAICLKAMARQPANRHATATELAKDVDRWLADEPVSAYGEPWTVRAGRWARKHKPVVATTAAVLLTATVGLAVGLYFVNAERNRTEIARQGEKIQRIEAQTQTELARKNEKEANDRDTETRAVLDFVENKVFAAARPEGKMGGLGPKVSLRKAVETALPFVEKSFTTQPLIEARLRTTLGLSFEYLGDAKIASDQYQTARTLYTKYLGPERPETLRIMNNLANSYAALGRHADALKLREETLALMKAKLEPDHLDTLKIMNNLALSYTAFGRHNDALKLYEETLRLMKAKLGPEDPDTITSMHNVARGYYALGRHDEAFKLDEETLAIRKTKLGPQHPDTLTSMHSLATGYYALGRHADAIRLYEESLALMRAKLGPDHPDTLPIMYNLSNSYYGQGRNADALQLMHETLALMKAKLGPDHPDTLQRGMYAVAEILMKLDRGAEAVPIIDECVSRAAGKVVHPLFIPGVMNLRLRHFVKKKDAVGCRTTADMWEKLARTDAASLYNAACMRAVAAAVIRASDKSESTVQDAVAEADRAMAWLRQAVASGYKDAAHMKKDTDLDTLRNREDFRKLLAELENSKEKSKK